MLTPSMTSSSGCYFFQTINFELVSELIQANVYLSNADGNQDFPDFLVSPISRSICSEESLKAIMPIIAALSQCLSTQVALVVMSLPRSCIRPEVVLRVGGWGAAQHSGSILASHPAAQGLILALPKIYFDVAEIYRRCWSEESGQKL